VRDAVREDRVGEPVSWTFFARSSMLRVYASMRANETSSLTTSPGMNTPS
jgi:hypothetical protein